jgi:hypothetical protein
MDAAELAEIRLSHGRHTGRKCQVCFMLEELDRRNADKRAAMAEEVARLARLNTDAAQADAAVWRQNVRDITDRLLATQNATLLARDAAARELAAAKGDTAAAHRALDERLSLVRDLLADVRLRLGVFPHTPRLRDVLTALDRVDEVLPEAAL